MAWVAKTSGTSSWLRGIWGIGSDPPTLTRTPVTPTPDVTSRLMSWSTASTSAVANIESLTLEGVAVVTNNVIQPGFVGTIALNTEGGYDVDVLAMVDQWVKLPSITWSIQFDNGIQVTETGELGKIKVPNHGEGWALDSNGNNIKLPDGRLKRDPTVATRALIRLQVRRGEWFGDRDLGSRLHTIQTTKGAGRLADDYIREALQPMIDDGSISAITVSDVSVQEPEGGLFVRVGIVPVGAENTVSLGRLPIGEQ